MIGQAALRRLGTWLVGLFFIAQTCGVVPLLGQHAAHVKANSSSPTRPSPETLRITIITTAMRMALFSITNCRT
ncbi:MAG TPA: hypothetical protein VNZ53_39530 [Steroidobacteraceae bacterium]|jgi:hypothetical protein|nr:hypothetical protein [Steroidobacteraceae bacterium]